MSSTNCDRSRGGIAVAAAAKRSQRTPSLNCRIDSERSLSLCSEAAPQPNNRIALSAARIAGVLWRWVGLGSGVRRGLCRCPLAPHRLDRLEIAPAQLARDHQHDEER